MKLITVLAGTLAAALAAESSGAGPAPEIDLLWAVKIPMRDGVRLNATVFKPKAQQDRLPVIFTLTPYNSDTYYPRARYFAQNGYVYALVDVRGRGNSEGVFLPFENEGRDGHDVVEWLAGQPWSNGKVAMWGGSYAGYDQWATLQNFPPHLTTIVPAAAAAMGVDFPAQNNVRTPYLMQWATYTSGVTPQPNLFGDAAFWISKFRELYLSPRPFRDFDRMVGNPSSWFQRVLQHPQVDGLWKSLRPSAADYARIQIPVLTITGHYDDDQYGAMHYYRRHMEHGTAEAKQRHFLVVGPCFSAWIALDVPDTDFRVSLYEVLADGTSVLLAEDVKRARHRTSLETETLVPSGAVLRYDFDQFPFFSRRVAQGSRLRLFLRCPNSIYLEKNYNGGGVVAEETAKDARTAHVAVHHDAKYPSALTLPIVN